MLCVFFCHLLIQRWLVILGYTVTPNCLNADGGFTQQ